MVARTVRYRCEKCQKGFPSLRDAETCELGHIVGEAVDGFKVDLARIFGREADTSAEDMFRRQNLGR